MDTIWTLSIGPVDSTIVRPSNLWIEFDCYNNLNVFFVKIIYSNFKYYGWQHNINNNFSEFNMNRLSNSIRHKFI